MKKSILPTGRQMEFRFGEQRATVVEVGGGLRDYTVNGYSVLDGYREEEMCSGARGQVLVPWPNRIEDGQYVFDGQRMQLDLSEPQRHNAIHGLVRFESWKVSEWTENRVVLEHSLYPKPGYPFILALQIEYTLSSNGLEVRTSAVNIGDRTAPFGMGAHPYLTVNTPLIDTAVLQIPASLWLPTDVRGLPIGKKKVEGTAYDFREPRPIGTTKIDYTYTDLQRDRQGRAYLKLLNPTSKRGVVLWVDASFPFLEIFTGENLSDVERQRKGLGVEPMSCAPNGFRSEDGLVRLLPGEKWIGTWGIGMT